MAKQTRAPDAAVTGVATGNLGTGTALDDTQVYSVDALATAEHPDAAGNFTQDEPVAAPPPAPPPVAAQPAITALPVAALPADAPTGLAIQPAATRPIQRQRRTTGGFPVGILTAGIVALIAVAAVLTMRDGGITVGGGTDPVSRERHRSRRLPPSAPLRQWPPPRRHGRRSITGTGTARTRRRRSAIISCRTTTPG